MQDIREHKDKLLELREHVNQSSDQLLEQEMQADWLHGILPDQAVREEDLQRIHQHILDEHIQPVATEPSVQVAELNPRHKFLKYIQIAASLVLPVCLVMMFFMYRENRQLASIPMTQITTHEDEQANVTLPDGTVVSMNSRSELKYRAQDFSSHDRQVNFQGEAHYQVTKDPEHPFTIHTSGMEIKVLGTEFNLINRQEEQTAEVALLHGSVKLTSLASGKSYTMSPNEVVILNKKTGSMDIHHTDNVADATAWQQKQMIFHDTPLSEVIATLNKTYKSSTIQLKSKQKEHFTGTLPTNNLEEAMKIIKLSYDVKIIHTEANKYIIK